jgi:hypothetical protein
MAAMGDPAWDTYRFPLVEHPLPGLRQAPPADSSLTYINPIGIRKGLSRGLTTAMGACTSPAATQQQRSAAGIARHFSHPAGEDCSFCEPRIGKSEAGARIVITPKAQRINRSRRRW